MHNGDVLGDEGRKALNACVKVKIYGKPETRRYDIPAAVTRLRGCYAGCGRYHYGRTCWDFGELVLPNEGNFSRSYDIVDIHDALVKFDERKCVEKYPKEGPESVKQRDAIDKRRAVVERELEEAIADPDSRSRYSWLVAQRRVRDCFAGNFPEDQWTIDSSFSNFSDFRDIYQAFNDWDKARQRIAVKRAALEKEYTEASTAEGNVKVTFPRYPRHRVLDYYRMDHPLNLELDDILPNKQSVYNIFDIHEELVKLNGNLLEKYPEEGPGSDELKKLIDKHRADLEEEYQKAKNHDFSNQTKYPRSEAERRVRDCFAGTFPGDPEILPKKEKDESDQTYDIFDIKEAIDHFDALTFLDLMKYDRKEELGYEKRNQLVDEERASIQNDYVEATRNIEVEHGSGFIVHDHFIITNRHVIESHLNDTGRYEIYISNAAIDALPCTVVHCDPGKDLALLYCPRHNLEQSEINPLQLSKQSLLPGMSVFTFGYPVSHTEETALFVSGNVSGSKRTLAGHSMIVLNCSLNSGNSGGPVLCWVNGQLKVVGVAAQKHFKEILTLEERQSIENIRESLQTEAIPDLPDYVKQSNTPVDYYRDPRTRGTPMALLTLKLYDALETHSQFNLSNALPGKLVVDFIKDSMDHYTGEHKEELAELVELAKDTVNAF